MGVTVKKSELFSSIDSLRIQVISIAVISFIFLILLSLLLINIFVSKPLRKTLSLIQELSKGHLSKRLSIKSNDEIGKIVKGINDLADTLQFKVLATMKNISIGNMDTEIDVTDSEDEIAPVLQNTVMTVNSITLELNEIIDNANKGQLNTRCNQENYKGNWASLAQGINNLMDTVAEPIMEVHEVFGKLSNYDFTEKINGQYDGIFKTLAEDVNTLRDRLIEIQESIVEVSNGDTSRLNEIKNVGKHSENDNLVPAIISMMQTIEDLINEVKFVANEAVNGNIENTQGSAEKFMGGYRTIIEGFNYTLEAVATPISEMNGLLQKISVNDFTARANEQQKGDFLKLAQSINNVQSNLLAVQEAAVQISNGDISLLAKFKEIGRRSENDKLMPALTQMMESIHMLIDDTKQIAGSAAKGKLDIRGEVSRYKGDFAELMSEINGFLDAVENPINKITDLINLISVANFGKH